YAIGGGGIGYRFFFQAEDGIRDFHVTGVQTCALPISVDHACSPERDPCHLDRPDREAEHTEQGNVDDQHERYAQSRMPRIDIARSEERRVGKESREGWGTEQEQEEAVDEEGDGRGNEE